MGLVIWRMTIEHMHYRILYYIVYNCMGVVYLLKKVKQHFSACMRSWSALLPDISDQLSNFESDVIGGRWQAVEEVEG